MWQERVSWEEALALMIDSLRPLGEEQVGLTELLGRTLARDVVAPMDQPPFDRSPLDGYALQSGDVQGASRATPAQLRVLERVCAGERATQPVTPGAAIRIMTGAPLPVGCDCVVRQEDTDQGNPVVEVYAPVRAYQNYVRQGEDYTAGTLLLTAGTQLDAAAVGLLASAGCDTAWVYRRPRVALLVTGDEVVDPSTHPLPAGKIYSSNSYLLSARLCELGVEQVSCCTVRDDPQDMAQCIRKLLETHHCLITTGGVSVGERDVLHTALELAGAQGVFWRVQLKPGTPVMYSLVDGKPVLSLSGNPFAAAATFELLGRPMLHALCPEPQFSLQVCQAILNTPFERTCTIRRFVRGIYAQGHVTLPPGHASGQLRSLVGCNCLVEVPAGHAPLRMGDVCTVYFINGREETWNPNSIILTRTATP